MEVVLVHVKRPYDASGRRSRADRARERVLACAHRMLLDQGYAATSVAAVAQAAGVSVETVYKTFGAKARLVAEVVRRALEGSGSTPAETRSDALQSTEPDPRAVIAGWGALVAEVSPLVAPLLLLVEAAAAHDREVATLRDELDAARQERMSANAARWAAAGHLRAGQQVQDVATVLWAYSAPQLYDLLVLRQGWSPQRFGEFVAQALTAHLLGSAA